MLDILIVGGGPIGLACGVEAKKAGLDYAIVEKGCLVNSLYRYPKNMTFFSTSEKLEIGEIPFMSIAHKPNRLEALEYYRRVNEHFTLNLNLFEEVLGIRRGDTFFEVKTSKTLRHARKVVIATGFFDIPKLLDIPGEHLPKVFHYYDEPHYFAGQRVAVIGASNSAIDAALEAFRKGAEVTLIVRGPAISERVKYWVKPDIENRLAAGEIDAHFNSTVTEILPDRIKIRSPQGEQTLANDFVLALTGYQPDFRFLEMAGVETMAGDLKLPVYDPGTMETNVPGLYLAGVVCGGMNTHLWFIENSRIHAQLIVDHICRQT